MATIYKPNSADTLAKFIEKVIDTDSKIVIPDLQRPYVWEPDKVILLVDSIFKKWPFGSLLCWDVENKGDGYIPSRPFWSSVARGVEGVHSQRASITRSTDSYTMILDGQQRIQSLVLALGGESWGFTLQDKEWKKHIEGRESDIDPKYWSSGCLCLNIQEFKAEYMHRDKKIANINVAKCLAWVTTDLNNGLSDKNKKQQGLPMTNLSDCEYIRFSKIWNMATPNIRVPKDYETILEEDFKKLDKEVLSPLAEFMLTVSDVKENTYITRLDIKNFKDSGIADRSNYNDAIVNIFARLNTAGRALSEQEITLAWIKTGWREADIGRNKDCQEKLQTLFGEFETGNSIKLNMDRLVDILSLFWTIAERNDRAQDELVLKNNDLLNGNIMKSIGKFSFKNWEIINEAILCAKEEFDNRKLYECFAYSFNAFYILCGWQFICKTALKNIESSGTKRETELPFDVQINNAFSKFTDRWFFSTLLAQTWSKSSAESYKKYISRLCKLYLAIKGNNNPQSVIKLLKTELEEILTELEKPALERINDITAHNRKEVIKYRDMLWLWNRLREERYEEVKKPLRLRRAAVKNEVDHAISVDNWTNKVNKKFPEETSRNSSGIENEFLIGERKFTRSKLISFINSIGNCSLLLRSHNRSKNKDEFGAFLNDVYGTAAYVENVKRALLLDDSFLYPSKNDIETIVKKIDERAVQIKKEISDYISNTEQSRFGVDD